MAHLLAAKIMSWRALAVTILCVCVTIALLGLHQQNLLPPVPALCATPAQAGTPALAPATSNVTILESPPPSKIEWLHIPKAGTSFGNTLLLWACPELEPLTWVTSTGILPELPDECRAKFRLLFNIEYKKPFPLPDDRFTWQPGFHSTLPPHRTAEQLQRVFTFIRSPGPRLISSFHMATRYRQLDAPQETICNYTKHSTKWGQCRGAQVAMIVGRDLSLGLLDNPPTMGEAEKACKRLGQFAFFGITDYWNASICLFHAMFGGTVHDLEYQNVRQGAYNQTETEESYDCGDTADRRLFDCGMELFMERIQQYPTCLKMMKKST